MLSQLCMIMPHVRILHYHVEAPLNMQSHPYLTNQSIQFKTVTQTIQNKHSNCVECPDSSRSINGYIIYIYIYIYDTHLYLENQKKQPIFFFKQSIGLLLPPRPIGCLSHAIS